MAVNDNGKHNVGGVLLDQPFKIRRLGHFGVNAIDMAGALRFYKDLLGFRIVDVRDTFKGKPVPDAYKEFGDSNGYFFRYGSDHHALVIYNQRLRMAMDKTGKRFRHGRTINQITWQVGSLSEVYAGDAWMKSVGQDMVRVGRDMELGRCRRYHESAHQCRPTAPIRHDAAGPFEHRDQRHDVEGLELLFDDQIDESRGEHGVVVAVPSEAMQQTALCEVAKRHGRASGEHVGMRAGQHRAAETRALTASQAAATVGPDQPAAARCAEKNLFEHGLAQ